MPMVGELNLGGSIEPVYNPVNLVEMVIEKGATTMRMPVGARKQLNDLPDDLATKVPLFYYSDISDALIRALDV